MLINLMIKIWVGILSLLFLSAVQGQTPDTTKPIKISGNTEYTSQGNQTSLISTIETKYRFQLFEHPSKSYALFLGGKITTDINHFGGTIKNNVYTTFGIDFW